MLAADNAAIANANHKYVGCVPAKLLRDLQCCGFLAVRLEWAYARVAAVPAEFLGGFEAQIECVVVSTLNCKNRCAKDEHLRDLGFRSGCRDKDHGLLSGAGANPSKGGSSVPGARRRHDGRAKLLCARDDHRAGPVLQRGSRVTPIVFDPQGFYL